MSQQQDTPMVPPKKGGKKGKKKRAVSNPSKARVMNSVRQTMGY